MTVIKKRLLIGSGTNSIETNEGDNFSGDYDEDALAPTLSFDLPYLTLDQRGKNSEQVAFSKLKKYDTVKLYFQEYNSDPGNVPVSQLTQIFTGYIDTISISKTKESFTYKVTAMGTAGLCNTRTAFYEITSEGNLQSFITTLFASSGLTAQVPVIFTDVGAGNLPINVAGGKAIKDVLDSMKERYAIRITQRGDGNLNFYRPSFLNQNYKTLQAWQFDLKTNIYELEYGDITSDVNAVVIVGLPPSVGMAIDTIGVQNNAGQISYQSFERWDLVGPEACEKYAQEKLLDLQKNFLVSFKTKFDPKFQVGDSFQLKDYDRYTGNEVFFIKKYSFTISKTDVSAKISGYTYSLTVLPENIVISNTGVADVDVIQIRDKVDNIIWNGTPK